MEVKKEEVMPHERKSKTIFRICECKKECYSKSLYYLHKKTCTKVEQLQSDKPVGRFKCLEEGCDFTAKFNEPLINHLENVHGFDCMEEVKSFFNYSEFKKWKEEYEKETKSFFILRKITKSLHGEKKYFRCNRSGTYSSTSTGKRLRKAKGLTKIGFNCPAQFIFHSLKTSEHISVHICHLHYGHDTDLAHVPLSKRDKDFIAHQLAQGINPSQILENVYSDRDTNIQRKHLITRKDIHNIAKSYGINRVEIKSEGSLSIEDYDGKALENEKSIVMYKKQGENGFEFPKDEVCPLDENDFVVGIMTDFQKEMFQKFGNNIICINVTHGKKILKFSLITILVIDEYRERIPVAWMICNRENFVLLKLFFKIVRKEVGDIQPEYCMSDKAPQYFNTWKEIFPSQTKKIICHSLLHQDWQRNLNKIKNKALAINVYEGLCILLNERDETKFEIILQNFCMQLEEHVETLNFFHYFKNEYLSIKEEWAKCYRLKLCINTNLYWQSLRKLQNCGDVFKKRSEGVEKCVVILLQLSRDLAIKRLIKLEKGKITWLSKEINKQHKLVLELPFSLVNEVSPTSWEVKSEQAFLEEMPLSEDLIYEVKEEPDCDKNCKIICPECNICVHSYTCNCSDALDGNICKHVHQVNIYKKSQFTMNKTQDFYGNNVSAKSQLINNDHCLLTGDEDLNEQNLIFQSVKSSTTDVLKQILLEKAKELYNDIQNCDNRSLLLASQRGIDLSISVFDENISRKRRKN